MKTAPAEQIRHQPSPLPVPRPSGASVRALTSTCSSAIPVSHPGLAHPAIVTFWRGRVALYAILRCLGIGDGDAVIVPGYTCFAVPAAVLFTGATPIYAEIAPGTYNVSLDTIQAALRDHPVANVGAILVQHTYGIPADVAPIIAWARARGIAVVEDCAHVSGSRYRDEAHNWRDVGTAGDAAFFSSQWTKPVSTGLGGWATTSNPELESALLRFRQEQCLAPSAGQLFSLAVQRAIHRMVSHTSAWWRVKAAYDWLCVRGLLLGTSTTEELRGEIPARYAMRMSQRQERLLKKKLAQNRDITHRRVLRISYDQALESIGLRPLAEPAHADTILLRYPVRVPEKQRILAASRRRKLDLGDWYSQPVDCPQNLNAKSLGYQAGMCPEGERAANAVVNLPMHPRVTPQLVIKLTNLLKEFT